MGSTSQRLYERFTECGTCGRDIEDDSDIPPSRRLPCPFCGSLTRKYDLYLPDRIKVNGEVLTFGGQPLTFSTALPPLLLQTVVTARERVDDGCLIEAVAIPWFEIIRAIENDPSLVHSLSARKWEEIVAGAYKLADFDDVILTPASGDRGRDIIAIKKGIGSIRVIDQVKAYKSSHLVTANDVRALIGVLHGDAASKGFLTTTSDFAPRLKEDPLIQPFLPSRLGLVNGPQLISRLTELATNSRNHK